VRDGGVGWWSQHWGVLSHGGWFRSMRFLISRTQPGFCKFLKFVAGALNPVRECLCVCMYVCV
jgi:hypothetical protein